jgi:hypothetical protein
MAVGDLINMHILLTKLCHINPGLDTKWMSLRDADILLSLCHVPVISNLQDHISGKTYLTMDCSGQKNYVTIVNRKNVYFSK